MNRILDITRSELGRRPWWMNLLLLFCTYMAVIYVPWDFFVKEIDADVEVWFGVRFYGVYAKLTEPIHFAIYAAGAWGFFKMRPWMWPWASVYAAQVTVSMIVWALLYAMPQRGMMAALLSGGLGALLVGSVTTALWRARSRFQNLQ